MVVEIVVMYRVDVIVEDTLGLIIVEMCERGPPYDLEDPRDPLVDRM